MHISQDLCSQAGWLIRKMLVQESSALFFCLFFGFFPSPPTNLVFSQIAHGSSWPPCLVPAAGMCQEHVAGRGQRGTAHFGNTLSCSFYGGMVLESQLDLFVFSEMICTLFDSSSCLTFLIFRPLLFLWKKSEIFPERWIIKCKHTHKRWTSACCFFCRALLYSLASLSALPGQVLTPGALNITNPSTPWSSDAVCISTEPDVWEHRSVRCCHPSALFKSHQSSTSEVSFFLELFAFWALDAALCFTREFCLVGC